MAREIPEVVRAVAGLAATVLDEARKLPETLPGLPVRLIGLAMQQAMKVQQQYAGLVARGDELFTGLRGEDEPGLATFDDDEPASGNGFRESAFDRAAGPSTADDTLSDAEVRSLPGDPAADAVTGVVDELADQVETGQQSIEELVEEAPEIEQILDEIAIDELVDEAPTLDETAPALDELPPAADGTAPGDAEAMESALLESDDSPTDAAVDGEPTVDVATTVDVLTQDGGVEAVDALVTDEGVAAPDTATATDEGGSPVAAATGSPADATTDDATTADATTADAPAAAAVTDGAPAGGAATSAPATPPIDGYDDFTIAQLRGRLRGFQLRTVEDLMSYEQANRAREPYLRMLRNRLEKLEQQAVENSPLAPRG